MFQLTVRDRIMIAHSFRGEVFGPAQQLHGATYVVEASFRRRTLDDDGLVVDIGLAHQALSAALDPVNYKNLDELDLFDGANTTTEFLAHFFWCALRDAVAAGQLGPSADGLCGLRVTLRESDVAWASFDAELH